MTNDLKGCQKWQVKRMKKSNHNIDHKNVAIIRISFGDKVRYFLS